MKKGIKLFILLALLFFLGVEVSAQERSYITVRASPLNNGVVIVDVVKAGKMYELQCNQGEQGCTALKNGNYEVVELPEHFGMYACRNVEIYPERANLMKDKKLGEYCLIEK
jgi:hypothetical protein